ncbi:MAG: hypothetical protein ABI593_12390 [Betaproteobacteria bacterium]
MIKRKGGGIGFGAINWIRRSRTSPVGNDIRMGCWCGGLPATSRASAAIFS